MILFINTSQTDLMQVKLIKDDKVAVQLENREKYKQSELLLSLIDKLIKKGGLKIKNLKMIVVVSGPGAFSALRLGVVTANTLAWSLKLPVFELEADDAISNEKLIKVLIKKKKNYQESMSGGQFKPVVPKYGRLPNITKSKSKKIIK